MVGSVFRVFSGIARRLMLYLLRGILGALVGDARASFARSAVETVFSADKRASLDAFVAQTARLEWASSEKEIIFASSCQLFDSDCMPDNIIEHFERASGGVIHYSQEGEDIILTRLLGGKRKGFFVDIGAHHPTRFSNTYELYRRGWRGINVDATPGSMEPFNRLRPDDLNLELAISDRKESLVFSMFKEGALNTFDRKLSQSYIESGWELAGTVELVPQPLAQVLDQHLEPGQKIDILSVDVEGEDLGVLRSNDWIRYCPEVVIIEALDTPLERLDECPVVVFLKEKGFVPISRLFNSLIFQRTGSVCAAS